MYDTFKELGIAPEILKAVEDMGFEEPSPIQKAAIPIAMTGKNLIGQAQTGTGKTAAFGIPILERIDTSKPGPQAVVLSPTRELAIQSAEEINHLAQYLPIHALPIYGGQDIERQFKALRKYPNIIVATPGRLMDHMKRGTIDLSHVQILVLDEGDEMVDMGFIDDIRTILAGIPEERQTMFFSATMPEPIRQLAETFLKEPELVKIKAATVTIDLIEQEYIELPDRQKFDALCRLLDMQDPELAIVFVRTKRRCDEVTEALIIVFSKLLHHVLDRNTRFVVVHSGIFCSESLVCISILVKQDFYIIYHDRLILDGDPDCSIIAVEIIAVISAHNMPIKKLDILHIISIHASGYIRVNKLPCR